MYKRQDYDKIKNMLSYRHRRPGDFLTLGGGGKKTVALSLIHISLGMVVPSMQDEIFQIEKNIIMDLADKGPCILVGRCADSILAERKNHFSIYIYASYENRLKNCCEYFEMEKAAAEKMIVRCV